MIRSNNTASAEANIHLCHPLLQLRLNSYGLAFLNHHLTVVLPTISATGSMPPESCYFTFFLASAGFLLTLVCFIYHSYVVAVHQDGMANFIGLLSGVGSGIGLVLVASFQFKYVPILHYVGMGLACTGQLIFGWCVVAVSYQLAPKVHGFCIVYFRVVVASISTLLWTLFVISLCLVQLQHDPAYPKVLFSVSEWALMLSELVFVCSTSYDFLQIRSLELDLGITGPHYIEVPGQNGIHR
uniref:transmembrane protein 150A isoform X6 n=1 Tax=Ciona intestinalis TaxID=7719 RepID=UPI000EF495DB|nr:transmembrane protein 150A isoform X6 [Ciona intestinalis]|eukprot:XP_026690694.1 transmembrane protein 150A isoform X6 [Ciona intestinalis]